MATLEKALAAPEAYFIILYPLFKIQWDVLFDYKMNGWNFTEYASGFLKRAAMAEKIMFD